MSPRHSWTLAFMSPGNHEHGMVTASSSPREHALDFKNVNVSIDGAASVIRTRDLTLTKGALYRWSYGSIFSISGPVQIKGQDRGGVYAANS